MKAMKRLRTLLMATLFLVIFATAGCASSSSNQPNTQSQPNQNQQGATSNNQANSGQNNLQDGTQKNPIVTITMADGGQIKAELYPKIAPNTVRNFIALVQKGFYNGLTFHRVIPGFMIQGGDPSGNGTGGPGYSIKGEFKNNGFNNNLKHERNVLSMARTQDPNSAGSQFFIMVAAAPSLDGDYAAFGKVISGMDVVDKIVNTPRDKADKPLSPPVMKTVTVDTFGINYPAPDIIK